MIQFLIKILYSLLNIMFTNTTLTSIGSVYAYFGIQSWPAVVTAVHSIITINTKQDRASHEVQWLVCSAYGILLLIITVHQETYTGDLTEHSPVVKLQKIHAVQLLFYWQSRLSTILCKFAHKVFCRSGVTPWRVSHGAVPHPIPLWCQWIHTLFTSVTKSWQ